MSRYILRARCDTGENFEDFLQQTNYGEVPADPSKLTVFVGDKMGINQSLSVLPCSGGLYSQQHFSWLNLDNLTNIPLNKLFFDHTNASVTLEVDLECKTNDGIVFGTASALIPDGALAVNLGSKGFQFNTSNLLNEDEWGKLVYYEQGGLGIGWAFSANSYFANSTATQNPLSMYVLGGLLPDVSFQILASSTGYNYPRAIPPYNIQIGRDQALLTQMQQVDKITGAQGYWSTQPTNLNPTTTMSGRTGGMLTTLNVAGNQKTFVPAFTGYNPFGFLYLSYPTASQDQATQSELTNGWNAQFPSYGPSTQDGYMPSGNALSIPPSSFFTDYGLQLMQNTASASSNPTVEGYRWIDYWKDATNEVHLEETRPFYIESPLFHASINILRIPNITGGLDLLVPITRIYNGVYLYVPIRTAADAIVPVNLTNTAPTDSSYFSPLMGTLQKWFTPKKVALTVNLPFVRIDTPLQACRFFHTVSYQQELLTYVPVWIKYRYSPAWNGEDAPINIINIETAATINQIESAMEPGYLTMTLTAREILNRMARVFQSNGVAVSTQWGLQNLTIRKVMVSCTPHIDLGRLYRNLYALNNFNNSPQGTILSRGGMKAFSRCGPSLSKGAPINFSLTFEDIVGDENGYWDGSTRSIHIDVATPTIFSRGDRNNDYFTQTDGFVFSDSISLRMPNTLNNGDSGGSLTIRVTPRPILNMPFSGEVLNDPLLGGAVFKNSAIVGGKLTPSNLSSYAKGWFNNLNPFSPDFNVNYNNPNSSVAEVDNFPYLDYKMVDFNKRMIEVWIQLVAPVTVYTDNPLGV